MEQLLADEWTNMDTTEAIVRIPVEEQDPEHIHEDIINLMEEQYGWSREAILTALNAHHVSSQVSTTYHLLDWKRHRPLATGQRPVWLPGSVSSTSPSLSSLATGGIDRTAAAAAAATNKKKDANCLVM